VASSGQEKPSSMKEEVGPSDMIPDSNLDLKREPDSVKESSPIV